MESQHYNQNRQDLSGSDQENRKKYSEGLNNLRDYFHVIYKKKISIIAIFLVFVIAGIIITLTRPKVFEASSLLVIGQIGGDKVETIHEVKAIFKSNAILRDLVDELGLSPETNFQSLVSKFDIKPDPNTEFLRINGRGETPEKALEVGNVVAEMVIGRHKEIAAQAQVALEEDIKQVESRLARVEASEKASQERVEEFRVESQRMRKDIEELIKNGSFVSEGRGLVIQAYIRSWQDSRDRLRYEEGKIKELEAQKEDLKKSLRKKELQMTYDDYFTRIEVPFVLPESKIAPNNRQNVKIAGFFGLFIGILYAFVAEYISKQKKEIAKD